MVELVHGLSAELVRANLRRVREEIADVGRDPAQVEILAAVKYVPVEELDALVEGGVTLVGENRAQELVQKTAAGPPGLTWDFIGHLQSRKVRDVVPRVRYIHSVAAIRCSRSSPDTAATTRRYWSRSTSPASRAKAASLPAVCPRFWTAARCAWSG